MPSRPDPAPGQPPASEASTPATSASASPAMTLAAIFAIGYDLVFDSLAS